LTGSYVAERLARAWYYLGGQNGVSVTGALDIGGHPLYEGTGFYYLAFGFLVVVYVGCRLLVRSQFGLVLAGARQREVRTTFLGYRVHLSKAVMFTLGGAIAGLAGGLYAFHEGFVWPSLLGPAYSTQAVLYVLVGGAGTLIGAVIGVFAIEFATMLLADYFQNVWPIMLGVLLLIVVMFRPTGLVGLFATERERIGNFRWRGAERAAAKQEERS
jgi:branched-chain amino acid transport system permease protein